MEPNPAHLVYRRQYYDSGETHGTECALCRRQTQFMFVLKDQERTCIHGTGCFNPSVYVGDCCFHRFKESNPMVYAELVASLILLRGQVKDAGRDSVQQRKMGVAAIREEGWKSVRRAAKARILSYRISSGEKEWLPRPFFELKKTLAEKPRQDYKDPLALARWYGKRTALIQDLIERTKPPNPNSTVLA